MSVTVREVKSATKKLCDIVIENEKYFCELDSVAGDGDFGMSLSKGFREIKNQIDAVEDCSVDKFIMRCSLIVTEYCGGATGPIWGAGLRAAAKNVQGKECLLLSDIAGMFGAAVEGIKKRGGARQGDKTLLDALIPAANALNEAGKKGLSLEEAFALAAQSAQAGAKATEQMIATRGRASYLGERSLTHPDAGAMAISVLFTSMV
ncbi:MAG: PTS-dependent dihydroxyacetone kinase, ADP-binding subunit DhaL [Firmicutes bacterium ADurb.Bin248]|nr:MAG: PTS-dependent dihydroxyacetone kinase, ADP-binding subunit DhaL [Firmicutes bacterium ADurb.Bin248]